MPTGPITCLTCHERFAALRGCCTRCFSRHRTAVAGGKATWLDLEALGLVAPARRPGSGWRRFTVG